VLYFGNGIIGLAAVMLCMSAIGAGAKLLVARRVFPAYALPTLQFDGGIWRSIRGYSVWNSLNDLMTEGTANLDKLLIPILLSSALVTPYSLVVMLAAAVLFIAEPITETFFPIASRSHGRNDRAALAGLLARGSKLVNVVTLPTLVVVLCFGAVTLDLWIGEEYTQIPATVLWFTALTFYFSTYLWTAMSILMAVGKVRMVFWASLLEVVVALLLIVALTPRYGLQGLAFAGFITNVAFGVKFILSGACKLTGLKLGDLLGRTLLMPLLAVTPALVLGLVLERQVQPRGWIALALCAGATGLVGALGIIRIATGRRERFRYFIVARRFLKPVRSIS
jgi:O-antigen/teichoic acid export membrane protein